MERPPGANATGSATFVLVNVFVRDFTKIDDVRMVPTSLITIIMIIAIIIINIKIDNDYMEPNTPLDHCQGHLFFLFKSTKLFI